MQGSDYRTKFDIMSKSTDARNTLGLIAVGLTAADTCLFEKKMFSLR